MNAIDDERGRRIGRIENERAQRLTEEYANG
ncbi:hypothetical protein SAMN05216285_3940 [Natrinema salifodinae]|uniref:Uncharacterized protein n=1 Tax=Natrinema salifodinae TaxID=1202768 RepID=A0A1I0QTT1_9EURY|nr:hypothetical protein SAMN05216285_3940 [Natrinema salifodinae]